MNASKKLILIIALGVCAGLLSFVISQYFSRKNQENQQLLSRVQRLAPTIEQVGLYSRRFIQNGDEENWRRITETLGSIDFDLAMSPHAAHLWQPEIEGLQTDLASYIRILIQIRNPAVQLNAEIKNLKNISLSFSNEVDERIIEPYRREEALQIYKGRLTDPFKIRIRETAYDVVALHLQQQLILLELIVDWDLAGYQRKKESIAEALERHKKQLHYLKILMASQSDIDEIIDSLDQKLDRLVQYEKVIFGNFSILTQLNGVLISTSERLLNASEILTAKIISDISYANELNQTLSWILLITVLGGLAILGATLARDIIRFVKNLEISREKLRLSENNLKVTLDSIGDAVIATDNQGVITRMNPSAEMLTGWPFSTAAGKKLPEVFRIINAQTRQTVADPAEKVIATGKIIGLANHTVLISRDGKEYQIADSGAPIRNTDGATIGVVLVFRDVTESYAQEQKLRENEKQLKEITANVPGVVFQFKSSQDHRYSTEYISKKAFEIFGLSAEPKLFFDAFFNCIPENEKSGYLSSIREAVARIAPWDYEGHFIKPDGEAIWFSGNSVPHKENEDIIFYGVLMDISQRKRLEESLRITQFSFDTAAIGIYRIGPDGRILDANNHAAASLGYSKEALCAMTLFDIDPHGDRENWKDTWRQFIERRSIIAERIHRRKDGSEFPVEISSNLLEFDGQQFAIAFAQDITERKKSVETLRQLRNYLSNIINSMPSVLVGVDREGRVTQWNRQAELATGLTFEKAQSQPLAGIFPRMGDHMESIRTAISEREVISESKIPYTQQGESGFEDITIFPLVANGVEGAVIRMDNVTERVRIEEMMIQSEKMLSVGGLAAGMAHEINNPLAGILQTAEVLASRLGHNLDIPASRKAADAAGITMEAIESFMEMRGIPRMLKAIRESGSRVAAIVDNMLSFARKSDATISSHSLEELIDKTLELAATDYDLKKNYDFKLIEIDKEYAGNLPSIPCEAGKIQQVLLNILRNGAQAMQQGGTEKPGFVIRTRLEQRRNMACIEIEDNGPGMDKAVSKRVFEPFFTTKPIGVGTGLGLSVSYFIITENHGGEMSVESTPGHGAKFIITLPVKPMIK